MNADPPRLLERAAETDDGSLQLLHDGLRAARAQGPSDAQRARLRTALGLPPLPSDGGGAGGTPGDGGATPTSAPHTPLSGSAAATGGSGVALKLVLGLAVAGVLTTGALWPLAKGERAPGTAAAGGPAVEPSASEAPAPTAMPTPEPRAATATAAAPAPKAPAETVPGSVAEPAAEILGRAPRRKPDRAAAAREPAAAVAIAASADPAAELRLLQRARAHVRSAPRRALGFTAEHAQLFPRGAFAQEREAIAIEALLHAGERASARHRAARFRTQHPRSAHLRRIDALFEEHAR